MIASGEKKEEYRELKSYWWSRLSEADIHSSGRLDRQFDIVRFKNGYSKTAPTIDVEFKGLEIGVGKTEWGATNECFIIKLGKIL